MPSAADAVAMPAPKDDVRPPREKPSREIPLQDIPAAPAPRLPAPELPPAQTLLRTSRQTDISQSVSPNEARKLPASAIRTLQSDIARTVRSNQLSIAQIALAQKEKARGVIGEETDDDKGRNIWLTTGSVALILGGLLVLIGAIYLVRGEGGIPFFDDRGQITTLIPAKHVEAFDVSTTTRATVLARIEAFIEDPDAVPLEVRTLVLTRTITGTTTESAALPLEGFMELIGSRAPGRLTRTLGPEMMLGAIGNEPFLLTTHASYENAFAGMLEWEQQMADGLSFLTYTPPKRPAFFDPSLLPSATTTSPAFGTSTVGGGFATTSATGTPPVVLPPPSEPAVLPATWKDIVVRNIDARALIRDEDDEVLLLYSFLRDGMLLIANRKETMSVVLGILATPHFGE